MTLTQFVATENSQALDYDKIPADTGQCVQLVAYYCVDVLGITPPMLNAVDWWNDYGSTQVLADNFTRIPYTSGVYPQPGDIVVFGASNSINSPLYGHIDICIAVGGPSGYTGFDSNWGGDYNAQGYPVAHQVQHNYTDVLGYLRYNGGTMQPSQPTGMNANGVTVVIQACFRRPPTPEEIQYWTGHQFDECIDNLATTSEYQEITGWMEAGKNAGAQPTVLAPGVYKVN
jgi:hypothetical protein